MRSDELYLRDILLAADEITTFLVGFDRARFLQDRVMQRAILQALTEIGEAANHVSEDLKRRYPHVAWNDARAFRNVAIHQYFGIDWRIVWATATVNISDLRPQIAAILDAEFPIDSAAP